MSEVNNKPNVQEITITNASSVKAIGTSTRSNRKPVLCITTGEIFASCQDACNYYELSTGNLSDLLNGKRGIQSLRGLKFCYINKSHEHIEEIASSIRNTTTVIMYKNTVGEKNTRTVHMMKKQKSSKMKERIAAMFKNLKVITNE